MWSFWDYREAYLRTNRDTDRLPIEGYLNTLATWANANRWLASALDYAPPMCAVEDLVALHRGGLAALRARRWLTDVVREAVHRSDSADPTRAAGPSDPPAPPASHRLASPRHSVERSAATDEARRPDRAVSTPATVGS